MARKETAMVPTAADFQAFLAVTEAALEHSKALVYLVNGGALRSALLTVLGSAPCFSDSAMWAGLASISRMGPLYAA